MWSISIWSHLLLELLFLVVNENTAKLMRKSAILGAHYLQRATTPHSCYDQSRETNLTPLRHWPETAFLSIHKTKGILKMDWSVKMSWHVLSMGVVCSYSCAPGDNYRAFWVMGFWQCSQTYRSLLTVYLFIFFCLCATDSRLLPRVAGVPI